MILVGVFCAGGGDGTDPYAEVSLQPLPEYTIPSDGVTMTCITCTKKGDIFLAGRDGHVYEMQYTTGAGWNKRCRKVCLTAGLASLVSRYAISLSYLMLLFYPGVHFHSLNLCNCADGLYQMCSNLERLTQLLR